MSEVSFKQQTGSRFNIKLDRITSNPDRMNGQPCIRNRRLTVRRLTGGV